MSKLRWFLVLLGCNCVLTVLAQSPALYSELKPRRADVFEFAEAPQILRDGAKWQVSFATKAACDVTVVVEDTSGKIIRHLASGVLGANAPAPFMKNSLKQMLLWDGKDDKGNYVDDRSQLHVRVSLGLKPEFEKALLAEPKRRSGQEACCLATTPEGVYVYDGRVLDRVCLFDHKGKYVRTIYPFPADKLKDVKGLHWHKFPQDDLEQPVREGFHQATYLSSGINAGFDHQLGIGIDVHNNYHGSVWGNGSSLLTVQGKQLALGRLLLNRLATDGSTGGLDLTGPQVTFPITGTLLGKKVTAPVAPRSAAFSPDGKYLYLTGYVFAHSDVATKDIVLVKGYDWLPGVARLTFAEQKEPEILIGSMKLADAGSGVGELKAPTSLAVDKQGRLYVTDFLSDRVQVFTPDGKLVKSLSVSAPAQVALHHETGEIYVFSWHVPTTTPRKKGAELVEPKLTILKSFDDPKTTLTCALPVGPMPERGTGFPYRAALDSWTSPPTIWLVSEWGRLDIISRDKMRHPNISLFSLQGDKLVHQHDFNADVKESIGRVEAPEYFRQRLYVNPATGHLYIGEGQAASGKSFRDMIRVDPETGKATIEALPFDAEDMCFDNDGLAYLRTFYHVARYQASNWKEVPWDYGEEQNDVRTSSSKEGRQGKLASGLRLPVKAAGLHHHGGMTVSVKGHLVVAVNNHGTLPVNRKDIYEAPLETAGKPYTPPAFPGRVRWGEVHVWDKHGQMLFEDATPGLNRLDGLGMDKDDNLYILATTTRMYGDKPYFNDMTGTLIKLQPKKNKVLSPSERAIVPLAEQKPERPPEVFNSHVGRAWVEGAQWFFGGVGFCGKNAARSGGGCDCWNARFALDSLGRSFAPEIDHHSVAIIDTAGNLIVRVGKYGNMDDPPSEKKVGDGVALFYAPYVATHTDKRLFIADPGNSRLVSVKLGYHTNTKLSLAGK